MAGRGLVAPLPVRQEQLPDLVVGRVGLLREQDASLGASVGFWQSRADAEAWRQVFVATVQPKIADVVPPWTERVAEESVVLATGPSAERERSA